MKHHKTAPYCRLIPMLIFKIAIWPIQMFSICVCVVIYSHFCVKETKKTSNF